ncbi:MULTISPECIES: VOC family protein [unclassified Sinorhizobium]|uniref:VOC family protein n=1 Tax=unclassified Sinorhizobium TaxID=2613772 RepID=UPI0024C3A504|nr:MULTISPECIES: VOC family protein [unclassified Sinorhizobium]MDK1377134.1 VOC family protein [Sinorhizobium sp. 6-70]MDK1478569.1 VOC family protein [Sinorhizobium sp. 6-117]
MAMYNGGRARQICIKLFVRHGDEERAIAFYRDVFGAELLQRHEWSGILTSADLCIGDSVFRVAGANPRRDAEPGLGGPRSPHALGTTAAILELHVDDVDRVLGRAIGSGASLRNAAETLPTGDRVGALIDPFGHIWALFTAIDESEVLDAFGVDRNAA